MLCLITEMFLGGFPILAWPEFSDASRSSSSMENTFSLQTPPSNAVKYGDVSVPGTISPPTTHQIQPINRTLSTDQQQPTIAFLFLKQQITAVQLFPRSPFKYNKRIGFFGHQHIVKASFLAIFPRNKQIHIPKPSEFPNIGSNSAHPPDSSFDRSNIPQRKTNSKLKTRNDLRFNQREVKTKQTHMPKPLNFPNIGSNSANPPEIKLSIDLIFTKKHKFKAKKKEIKNIYEIQQEISRNKSIL